MKIKLLYSFILLFLFTALNISCKKFLDEKPDIKLAFPSTLQDLQAILDNSNALNNGVYPSTLEIAAGDFYINYADWLAQSLEPRSNFIWDANAEEILSWSRPYILVYNANTVLDNLTKIQISQTDITKADRIKGAALFFRSYGFYFVSQLYCKPYDKTTASSTLGIPLRLTADINVKSVRSSLQETYDRIVNDLKLAAEILPVTSEVPTRPNKVAAFSALARTYLIMGEYKNAGSYADSALAYYSELIDLNTLNPSAANPMVQYNKEVIFHSYATSGSIFAPARAKVDSNIIKSYADRDLRKSVYYQRNTDGSYRFKANYTGMTGNQFFTGIGTNELYLIKAECEARQGKTTESMNFLNELLINRWQSGYFIPFEASDSEEALTYIIKERRKELVFRGLRWTDLRRLNKDPQFAVTLTRAFNDGGNIITYTLPPNDPRYVLLIPVNIINLSGIQQNER